MVADSEAGQGRDSGYALTLGLYGWALHGRAAPEAQSHREQGRHRTRLRFAERSHSQIQPGRACPGCSSAALTTPFPGRVICVSIPSVFLCFRRVAHTERPEGHG